ncbi:uncharacterized protein LAESUDRAFT_718148 [Laetiporus sulphureus 93-53]|uniref:Uncharacterized protein n=1 Tax=Laetiporus sulphureus 93-53 TaxID=1314785 RepID=A0A165B7G8_9APHY|nr:uncharacterized protein LAESUDRAFT_718148 [Laetiporus sulphureus 93-53]KZT00419.1 hypothetical protein LAESUDRAFT_718148 [Laetiporus sulphureus 93-53]
MTSKGCVHNPFLDLEVDVDDGEEMSEDDEAQEAEDDEAQEAEDDVAQDDKAEDDEVEVGEAAGDDIAMHLLYSVMAREDDEDDDDVVELAHQYQERAHRGRESASHDHAVEAEEHPPLPNEHCRGIWMLRTKWNSALTVLIMLYQSLADQDEDQNAIDEPRSHSVYFIFVSENWSCIDEADRIYVEAKSMHDNLKISSTHRAKHPALRCSPCVFNPVLAAVVYGSHTVQEQMPGQDNEMKMYMFKKKLFKDGPLCVSCKVEQLRLLDKIAPFICLHWISPMSIAQIMQRVYFTSLAINDHVRVTEGELQGIEEIIQSITDESVEVAYGPSQSQVATVAVQQLRRVYKQGDLLDIVDGVNRGCGAGYRSENVQLGAPIQLVATTLSRSKRRQKNRATYQHFVLKRAMISWGQYKAHKGFIKDEYNDAYQMELDAPRGVVVWLKPSEFRYLSDQQDTLPLGYATSSIPSSSGIPSASQDTSMTSATSTTDPSSTGDNPMDQYAALTLYPQDNALFLFHLRVQQMLPILKRLTLMICNTKGTSPEAQWEQGQYEDEGVTVLKTVLVITGANIGTVALVSVEVDGLLELMPFHDALSDELPKIMVEKEHLIYAFVYHAQYSYLPVGFSDYNFMHQGDVYALQDQLDQTTMALLPID